MKYSVTYYKPFFEFVFIRGGGVGGGWVYSYLSDGNVQGVLSLEEIKRCLKKNPLPLDLDIIVCEFFVLNLSKTTILDRDV